MSNQNIYGDSFFNHRLKYSAATSGLTIHYLSSIYPAPPSIDSFLYTQDPYRDYKYEIDYNRKPRKSIVTKYRKGKNIPYYKGKPVDPINYTHFVIEGYTHGLNVVKYHIESFSQMLSLSTKNWNGYMRILLRRSGTYAKILRDGFQAEYMTDGIFRSIFIQELFRFYDISGSCGEDF